ncbi:unnamed protein product [Gadus morhua 'NCC']
MTYGPGNPPYHGALEQGEAMLSWPGRCALSCDTKAALCSGRRRVPRERAGAGLEPSHPPPTTITSPPQTTLKVLASPSCTCLPTRRLTLSASDGPIDVLLSVCVSPLASRPQVAPLLTFMAMAPVDRGRSEAEVSSRVYLTPNVLKNAIITALTGRGRLA